MDFDEERLKRRVIVKDVPFGGLDDGQPHLGGQISLKKVKNGLFVGTSKTEWRSVTSQSNDVTRWFGETNPA